MILFPEFKTGTRGLGREFCRISSMDRWKQAEYSLDDEILGLQDYPLGSGVAEDELGMVF